MNKKHFLFALALLMSASTHNVWCTNNAEKESNEKVMVCKQSFKPQYNKFNFTLCSDYGDPKVITKNDFEKWNSFVSLPSPTIHKPLKTEDSPEKATN